MHVRSPFIPVRETAALLRPLVALPLLLCWAAPASAQSYQHAQGGFVTWPWVWQNPSNSSHYRIWTAEDGARIRYKDTTTGGWTFQVTPLSQTKPYRFIAFHDDGITGVAVGDGGQWAWTDSGDQPNANWKVTLGGNYVVHPSNSGLNPQLWSVVAEPSSYWVVGQSGLLAWTDQIAGSGLTQATFTGSDPYSLGIDLHGIDFTSDGVYGAAVGNSLAGDGRIYYTDDSGATWNDASISFLTEGCAPDGPPASSLVLWKVSFSKASNSLVGYAVGTGVTASPPNDLSEGRVFRTADGGQTWTEERYEHDCTIGPYPICSAPGNTCGGSSLTLNETYHKLPEMYAVHTFDDGGALAVGYGATVLERPFNSSTWLSHTDRCDYPTGPLWGVHGDGQSSAWISGHSNQIRRTNDRGATWTQEGWDKHWRLAEMAAVSSGGTSSGPALWVVGQQRRIARSLDGGVTWAEQYAINDPANLEFGRHTTAIAVYDDANNDVTNDVGAAVGMTAAVGGGWVLQYTVNGGGTSCGWSAATVGGSATPRDLSAVCASGKNGSQVEFWAVGASDTILVSRDNGATWNPVTSPTSGVTWLGVTFTTLDDGWIVGTLGSTGYALRVTSGSTTPVLTLLPTTTPLQAVHGRNANVYAVGAGGAVFKYNASLVQFDLLTAASALTTKPLSAVQVGRKIGGHEVFVGGLDGVALRYDGSTWSMLPKSQTSSDISTMAFLSAVSGFALGNNGTDANIGAQSTLVRYSNP